ncbi:unnamed protein product [Adineta ricciae]|uniref:G-protein coupled receptors family 1 profile domain-containing protein n=1 Tax=Adineta ricciae TaxID=249248 RepID=A0A815JBM3_ADIRI|nr:unnamed protein product [Adineta ricciae]
MWTKDELVRFQQNLFIISIPIIIITGNIGSILNVIVFSGSTKLRASPCSLYLIFSSICYAVYLNTVPLLRFLQTGFNIDLSAQWSWFCKLRFFTIGLFLMLPRSYMLLAAVDRYLMSKTNHHWFLRRPTTWKMIIINYLFWAIVCVHDLIFYDIQISYNSTDRTCTYQPGPYSTFLSFYSILINGISMPLLTAIFAFLTLQNLKSLRKKIHTSIINNFQRRRKEEWLLCRMLLIQLFATIVLTLPITSVLCYNGLTQYQQKSSFRTFVENYIFQMCTLLQYINAAVSFIVYSLTSRIFCKELVLLVKYYTVRIRQTLREHSAALFTRLSHSCKWTRSLCVQIRKTEAMKSMLTLDYDQTRDEGW